jgi:GTP-binding protein Era
VSSKASSSFRSGFVAVVGRPNVGKSTLVNKIVGEKVSITSSRPQTTRSTIRGVLTSSDTQLVLLDTPGLHKPSTELGKRTNQSARAALEEVDVICFVVEASDVIGSGDRFIATMVQKTSTPCVLVLNKIDIAARTEVVDHLATSAGLGDFAAYVPCSALTGDGVDVLVEQLLVRLPEGPQYYPDGVNTDQAETFLAAELVREQLLERTWQEVPHSIGVTAEELDRGGVDHPADVLRLRVTIRVERDSQKGIVIGRGGAQLKEVVSAARRNLEALLGGRVYLETRVVVEPDWQRRPGALDRMGF